MLDACKAVRHSVEAERIRCGGAGWIRWEGAARGCVGWDFRPRGWSARSLCVCGRGGGFFGLPGARAGSRLARVQTIVRRLA